MSRLIPSVGWTTPETLRGKDHPDPRNVRTSPKKRSTIIKSRPSISSLFSSRQRSISPYQQRMNPEEISCEEGQHYPLYDAHNPYHNPSLMPTSGTSQSKRRRASTSTKKSSLKKSQTPYNSPQKTISRLLHGLTGSMRAAANYFHETEDVSSAPKSLVKSNSKSPVRFKPASTATSAAPESSLINVPKSSTPSLLGIGISRTPFMSTTSLGQAVIPGQEALPDPFSNVNDAKTDTRHRFSTTSSSSSSTISASSSKRSHVQENQISNDGVLYAKKTGQRVESGSPGQTYMSRTESQHGDLNASSTSASPSSSIEVAIDSDIATNADTQNDCKFSGIRGIPGPGHNITSSRSTRPFAKNDNDLLATRPSYNTIFASPLSRKSSANSEMDVEPSMGSLKHWLDVKADRDRRYRATMSGASTDDDSDVGVRLSRLDETKKPIDAREPFSRTPPKQSIFADENVSPLDINRQTPSPAHIPLPKSENFTRYFEPEIANEMGPIGTPTQQIENDEIFSADWDATNVALKNSSRACEESSECDSVYSGSAELSSHTALVSPSEQSHDEPSQNIFLSQMDQKPLVTLQDELAGRGYHKKHARFTRRSSTASDRDFSLDERNASWFQECGASSVYRSRPRMHNRALSGNSATKAIEVANALASAGVPPKSVQDIVKEIRNDGDDSDSESDELAEIL